MLKRELSLEVSQFLWAGFCRYERITCEESYVSFAQGSNTFLHIADGAIELVFSDDSRSQRIASGETRIVPKGEPITKVNRLSTQLELYTVEFTILEGSNISKDDLVRERQTPTHPARLIDFFRQYLREQKSSSPSDLIRAQLIRLMLVLTEPEGGNSEISGELNKESVATQIDAFIASHYADGIDTPAVASHLRYNVNYLERVYHNKRGTSITQSISRRRVHEACALLKSESDLSISEVAVLCGFADVESFRKAFKQIMKQTPSAFRESRGDE